MKVVSYEWLNKKQVKVVFEDDDGEFEQTILLHPDWYETAKSKQGAADLKLCLGTGVRRESSG